MPHLALYRKYRSQTFGDLVGQDHVTKTIQSGIERGRIAQSYLFTGPRGTGKTSTARLLAKALNCEKGPAAEPCNTCGSCLEITTGNCMDVIEMDAASESGIEAVRESIVEAVDYQPAFCKYRVFIIDEVHDLSKQAFDALLKTIEEPPSHVIFILATTELSKVPATIRSRCQRYEFHRGTIRDLESRLQFVSNEEGIDIDPAALTAIARLSDGGFRDSLTLLEQAMLTTDGRITLDIVYQQLGLISDELVDSILTQMSKVDICGLIETLESVYRSGRDPRTLLESMLYRLADLTRVSYGVDSSGISDSSQLAAMKATSVLLGGERMLRYRSNLATAHLHIRDVSIPKVWLEAEIIRIALDETQERTEVPRETAQAPQPVKKVSEPVPPKNDRVVSGVAAASSEVEATDDPLLYQARGAWSALVAELSKASAVARERLSRSRVDRLEGSVAKIEFPSQMILDLVSGSKLDSALRTRWAESGVEGTELSFFFENRSTERTGSSQAVVEATAVELVAEGERLVSLVHQVFGVSGNNENETS